MELDAGALDIWNVAFSALIVVPADATVQRGVEVSALAIHDTGQDFPLSSFNFAPALHEDVDHGAVLIDGTPEMMLFGAIQLPFR